MSKKISPVQIVIGTLRDESMKATGHSYTRLNGVLGGAMNNLIIAGVKFEIDDVSKALSGRNSGYWSDCESWYSSACGQRHGDGGGNLSAAMAIEKHLGRTPFIWAERTRTPGRLCIGSQFTWSGERVTVTSFDDAKKTLTACSYKDEHEDNEERIGNRFYLMGEYRILESRKDYDDGSVVMRFSAKSDYEPRKVKKRFCISNEEMQKVRADYDGRRRRHEKAIKAATTLDELKAAKEAAQREEAAAYRHFDLEIISAAIQNQLEEIVKGFPVRKREEEAKKRAIEEKNANAAIMDQWLIGDDVRPYFSGIIRLRVKGAFVECSNGNKVSLESALKTLPFVHRYRVKGWQSNGQVHDVDAFRLERIDDKGVQIGCTFIPWEEVDRFTPILKKARKTKL